MNENNLTNDDTKVIKTDIDSINGQDKCPKCGSTDISTNIKTGKLRCNFCRHEFEHIKLSGMVSDISTLEGQVIGSGASDIIASTNDVLTFKCSSCGAEVVIDTASAQQARCHWCRNILSVNQQIPNGSIPDVVLPFNITKDTAKEEISKFVGKRKFYAHPKFREEFTANNVMAVYFPYMLVDVNTKAHLDGVGEHQTRKYYVGTGDNQKTYYDADSYHVERKFNLTISGLSVESNLSRLDNNSKTQTNNIINAIMPFDVENSLKYNANFLRGCTSERRDTNIEQLKQLVDAQSNDIVRFAANKTLEHYDRGVCWNNEDIKIKGQQWKAAYLPVWLYSYQQVSGTKKVLHYVAVNARTKETKGSVPIHMPKLIGISILVEILGMLAMRYSDFDYNWLFLLSGIIYFIIIYSRYRNSNARHNYELETETNMTDLEEVDEFIESKHGLSSPTMLGANNTRLTGTNKSNNLIDQLSNNEVSDNLIDSFLGNSKLSGIIKDNINKRGGK